MVFHKDKQIRIVMGLSLGTGLLFWIADSYFEYRFFHENLSFLLLEGPESFLDSLVFRVPVHSVFVRLFFLAAALLGGGIMAVFLNRKRKSDEALRISEEKYRNIFETARDALIVCNPDTETILDVNRFACDLYGYSRDEMRSMNLSDLSAEPDQRVITAEKETNWIPLQYHQKKNGDIFPTEISVSFSSWKQNKTCTAIIRDISARTQIEKEKIELEARLHRAQKMEALGTLAGGVAHDLNNILSALVGYPDLLLMDMPEDSPLRKPILTIQKSGQKAADIVQDLLTLARRGVTTTQVVNLNDIISDYFKSLEFNRLQSAYPLVGVDVDLDDNLHYVAGSPVHLLKTVMNLVSNAVEAMTGPGTIEISTRNEYLDKPIRGYEHVREGDYIRLRIIDTGIGMSREDLSRIFEPFYTRKVMGKSGTGLGMAVVWGAVKDHRGYIDLKSSIGKGTQCDVFFPVTRDNPSDPSVCVSIDWYRGTECILVVDDDADQREIVDRMLSRLGYGVTCVSSGEAAIDHLRNHSADLVILDMIMDPGIDGLETYRRIITHHPGQKAVISSGFSETDRVREVLRLGAGAYIKKPYITQVLAKTVRKELDKARG